jgi:hypothetical protein
MFKTTTRLMTSVSTAPNMSILFLSKPIMPVVPLVHDTYLDAYVDVY